jgi:hypothetical protein
MRFFLYSKGVTSEYFLKNLPKLAGSEKVSWWAISSIKKLLFSFTFCNSFKVIHYFEQNFSELTAKHMKCLNLGGQRIPKLKDKGLLF